MIIRGLLLGILPWALAQRDILINPKNGDDGASRVRSLPIDLSGLVNNRAFAMSPGDANFDGMHSGYPSQGLPPENLTYAGVNYIFPQYRESGDDNVLAQGQMLHPPRGRYFSVQMLAAAETSIAQGFVNATYSDNTTTSGPILVHPWWDWPYPYGGDVVFPGYYTNISMDYNRSMIFQTINWLDSTKELVSLQLPNVTAGSSTDPGGEAIDTRLHIFAATLLPATDTGIGLEVQYARSTKMWMEGTNKTQIVEVHINNMGTEWVLANNSVRITVSADGLNTVVPGVINRLQPGDQAIVHVGVENAEGVSAGTTGPATVHISGADVQGAHTFDAMYGVPEYEPTFDSIYSHEAPTWYSNAKYGIFIHWGPYSVPAWGNKGDKEDYAEWYWWHLNNPDDPSETYQYHRETYGPDVVYDDFIANFTADAFDAKEWVDLFADAGAKYFVQVSKHHDGYAIFDLPSNVTNRTSVSLPPHRNLLEELFDAADQYQPQMHKATYFSLPEWFSPAYAEYGFGSWPGGNATNPFTNDTLPYTGFVPVADYVPDVVLPSMLALADMGTEIMWCDIGGPNLTAEFAAQYFNAFAARGQQVLLDNRCGLPGDFDTPEYASYASVQRRKWESSRGMDPYSYGYNRATPEDAYLTAEEIVTTLVDIVSKNGNFLLDIGPTANGSIIDVEKRHLRAAGRWIREHGEAIFDTTFWFVTPQEGEHVRFTQTAQAFYIVSLAPPNGTLTLRSPVPYVPGDAVTVVGGGMAGTAVPSRLLEDGSLEMTVSEEARDADRFAWVFKIAYSGAEQSTGNATVGGGASASRSGGVAQQTANAAAGQGRLSRMAVAMAVLGAICLAM